MKTKLIGIQWMKDQQECFKTYLLVSQQITSVNPFIPDKRERGLVNYNNNNK